MSEILQGGVPGWAEMKSPNYRVLLLDRGGKLHSSVLIPGTDDEGAKAVARRMANGLSAELWDGRGGSGNLDSGDEWNFCLTAARMAADQEQR